MRQHFLIIYISSLNGKKVYDNEIHAAYAKMCTFPVKDLYIPHLKCIICCWSNCPFEKKSSDIGQHCIDAHSICYHIYKEVGCCILYGKIPLGVTYKFDLWCMKNRDDLMGFL